MSRKQRPTREEIDRLYNNQNLSTVKIGEMYGVSPTTIIVWLRDYGIRRRTTSEAHLPKGVRKPSKEELDRLYNNQNLSTVKIGEMYSVSASSIGNWLRDYEIRRRTPSEAQLPEGFKKPNKEEMDKLYNGQNLSESKIGEMYGVSPPTVRSWLIDYGFRRRTTSEALLPIGFKKPSKEEMEELLKRLPITQIAEEFGISSSTVYKLIDSYKLNRKRSKVKHGSWKSLEYTIEQAKKFLEENPEFDVLPSLPVLRERKYGGLASAITKYHGGFPAVRARFEHRDEASPSLLETYAG